MSTFDFRNLWNELASLTEHKLAPQASDFSTSALDWTGWLAPDDDHFIGGGSFGDVFRAKWNGLPKVLPKTVPIIVVKVIRSPPLQDNRAQKRFKVGLTNQLLAMFRERRLYVSN